MVVLMGTAASAQYPGPTTAPPTTAPPTTPVDVLAGQDFTVTGDGCAANTPVYIVIDGTTPTSLPPAAYNATTTSDAAGNFVVVVHIPEDISLGLHTIYGYCLDPQGDIRVQYLPINVTGRVQTTTGTTGTTGTSGTGTTGIVTSTGTSSGALARTGAPNHTGSLLAIGAAAIVLGASFVYGATRRRPKSTDSAA